LIKKLNPDLTTCIHIGSKEEKNPYAFDIILSSYPKFAEHVDSQNIWCVVLLSPPKNKTVLIQTLGRGIRLNSIIQKVLLIDFVDNYFFLAGKWRKRRQWYEQEEFSIKYMNDKKPKDLAIHQGYSNKRLRDDDESSTKKTKHIDGPGF
jgi:superfamily II DNA or RNA helicase